MFEVGYVKEQAQKLWNNQSILQAILNNENRFPLYINLPTLSSRQITDNFIILRTKILAFIESSKAHNLHIIFKEIKHRQFGVQRLPKHICFNTLADYLYFIGKEKEYKIFCQTRDYILQQQPTLNTWLIKYSAKILEYQKKWYELLQVCSYFQKNPKPNKYIRELEISGVDSKFIEQNKGILTLLLNEVLPSSAIEQLNTLNRRNDFEIRYGLKYTEALIRCRLLDNKLINPHSEGGAHSTSVCSWQSNITDFTLPLSQFAKLNIPCHKVFITENKINGLSFPDVSDAIIIFGLGYGIESLKNISWLQNKEIIYWGDIDTHGFAILSQLRSYYPQTQSILMDLATLNSCRDMWVGEPEHTRCTANLPHLTKDENELYQILLNNQLGTHIRLEQERISYANLHNILI